MGLSVLAPAAGAAAPAAAADADADDDAAPVELVPCFAAPFAGDAAAAFVPADDDNDAEDDCADPAPFADAPASRDEDGLVTGGVLM